MQIGEKEREDRERERRVGEEGREAETGEERGEKRSGEDGREKEGAEEREAERREREEDRGKGRPTQHHVHTCSSKSGSPDGFCIFVLNTKKGSNTFKKEKERAEEREERKGEKITHHSIVFKFSLLIESVE